MRESEEITHIILSEPKRACNYTFQNAAVAAAQRMCGRRKISIRMIVMRVAKRTRVSAIFTFDFDSNPNEVF